MLGLSLRALIRRAEPRVDNLASVMYLASGSAFRYAWVDAGRASAADHAAVAAMGRGRQALHDEREEPRKQRVLSVARRPLPLPDAASRGHGEALRRVSLAIERRVRRAPQ